MKTQWWPCLIAFALAALPGQAAEPVVAKVLGKPVLRSDIEPTAEWLASRDKHLREKGETPGLVSVDNYRLAQLKKLIWVPLEQQFRGQQNIETTENEIDKFLEVQRKAIVRRQQENEEKLQQATNEVASFDQKLQATDLSATLRKRLEKQLLSNKQLEVDYQRSIEISNARENRLNPEQERFFAKWQIDQWEVQQSLYKKYGGRVIWQQVGPEAIDAMRDFLLEHQQNGTLAIYDKSLSDRFWEPFLRDRPGVFVKNAEQVFKHPWSLYEMQK